MARATKCLDNYYIAILYTAITFVLLSSPAKADSLPAPSTFYPYQHVILADCGQGDEMVSEAAYYKDNMQDSPTETAQVMTSGQSDSQLNSDLWAYFSGSDTHFTAKIGKGGKDGDISGTASDGYSNFTCYQMPSAYVYSNNDNLTCFQRYSCGYGVALSIATTPSPSSPTTSSTTSLVISDTTSLVISGMASSSSSASSTSDSGGSLSMGQIIGLSNGLIVGALFVAGAVAFVIWRRRARKRKKDVRSPDDQLLEIIVGEPDIPPMVEADGFPAGRELEAPFPIRELDGRSRPVETHGVPVAELEGDSKIKFTLGSEVHKDENWTDI
ncbi:hypothetical protein F4781DRAFT_445387 [Annulohypoxylon bovei var. microspora]|nr:hypothetical protein F4781DRAFT_445387 [Annulohypoxylon bovei var. microspora]